MKPPQSRPCGSCPYRRDVPSGVWHPEEYVKLPQYDNPMPEQPKYAFDCHQQDGHLCAGWVGTHDMSRNLAIRIAMLMDWLKEEDWDAVLGYESPVPLFESGRDAMLHGMREIHNPGPRANKVMNKLRRKGLVVDGQEADDRL